MTTSDVLERVKTKLIGLDMLKLELSSIDPVEAYQDGYRDALRSIVELIENGEEL